MKRKNIFKLLLITAVIGILGAIIIGMYMFNMPHRDVQATKTDYTLTSTQLVDEYLANSVRANEKYLQEEGESKILAVSGKVLSINRDQKNQLVVLLKDPEAKAGVSCTFMETTNDHAKTLQIGQNVTIKGVIRSGASFDEDLDMYEDVIMEKCDVIN